MYKILTIKWKQLLVHIWRNTETNGKQQLDNPIRIGSMVTHFQLPPYIAIIANSLNIWFLSKEQLCGQYGMSLRNYPVQNRVERGRLPTCDKFAYRYVWSNSLKMFNMCRSGTWWWRVWVWRTVGFTSARSPPTRHSPSLCVYMCQVSSTIYLLTRHSQSLCVYMCQVSSTIYLLTRHSPSLCVYMCQVSSMIYLLTCHSLLMCVYLCQPFSTIYLFTRHSLSLCVYMCQPFSTIYLLTCHSPSLCVYMCQPFSMIYLFTRHSLSLCVYMCQVSSMIYSTCLPATVHHCAPTCVRSVHRYSCFPATVHQSVSTCARSVQKYTCLPAAGHHWASTCARSVHQYMCTCLPATVYKCTSPCARLVKQYPPQSINVRLHVPGQFKDIYAYPPVPRKCAVHFFHRLSLCVYMCQVSSSMYLLTRHSPST
jgi:hypothetical protein